MLNLCKHPSQEAASAIRFSASNSRRYGHFFAIAHYIGSSDYFLCKSIPNTFVGELATAFSQPLSFRFWGVILKNDKDFTPRSS